MLFDSPHSANVFGMPLGVDFPRALVSGLLKAYAGQPPEALARVQLVVNTGRMRRRIGELFDQSPALLLPRISLISESETFSVANTFAPAIPAMQRELEVAPLIHALIDGDSTIAPRSAVYDLASSLVGLISEMHEEGVSPAEISKLDVSDQSGHWARAQDFFNIANRFFDATSDDLDTAARQRLIVEKVLESWEQKAPDHPIIIAGSTGSRGLTQLLMQAVAQLPQGAVVLPGYDYDFAQGSWSDLSEGELSEDHPQYRFDAYLKALGLGPRDVRPWPDTSPTPDARTKLLSLALRPAPVTDQWITDGPKLAPVVDDATNQLTLLEANSQREEAVSIALRLRAAAETGTRAALITPDRTLSRQVSAALGRWGIIPDDSAGEPLHLSPLGRLMRHTLELMQQPVSAELLITLLKHPLCHMGEARGQHLLNTGALELFIRRRGIPHPDAGSLLAFSEKAKDESVASWAGWVSAVFMNTTLSGSLPIADLVSKHITLTEAIGVDTSLLWSRPDGVEAQKLLENLNNCAPSESEMTVQDYANLTDRLMSSTEVRRSVTPHSNILIWGTLEARVQGVDLLILAGLNEGSWPEALPADPWLNRAMRLKAGLLLPERKIGLSAHDFQQAASAPEVWLSRSQKSDDAETVPSRWVIRLTNLLEGMPDDTGTIALKRMRARGQSWLSRARLIDAPEGPQTPAVRPAPCPPVAARPRQLSITEIQKLTRDPYAVYAKHVLKLRPLGPLQKLPDALLRGIVLHGVMERFVAEVETAPETRNRETLLALAEDIAAAEVPWPAARLMWLSRFESIVDAFLAEEQTRVQNVAHSALEREAKFELGMPVFTLTGKADRLDFLSDDTLAIYDYKTGIPPTKAVRDKFDQQLPLTAMLAENGAFSGMPPMAVSQAAYIGLGSGAGQAPLESEEFESDQTLARLRELIAAYLAPDKGFPSRRAVEGVSFEGDYDHLARYGEWSGTDAPVKEVLT
ncbi:double-strand break repair protein AddB [Lentibacter algarum]|uniref:double-strand break repair protein AddB n=1 Tax=Lentibacter algarum TaxID=576131 RepID=UPI001C07DB7A|nr:double-strand break repair protein AddB [Lentibacter algarum]MBU2980356.1 double-strand break repair protein AddB [Lentibacter algarum]